MNDPQQFRLLALVTVTAASITAASIFLFLSLRKKQAHRTYQQQKKPLSPRTNILVDSIEFVEEEEEEEEEKQVTMPKEGP
jgi:hypothetical protein